MPGETTCILGKSGVGKSVCLRIVMGFLKPDSGRVTVAQQDITSYSEEQLLPIRKEVTMVFQTGALFDSLSLAENVAFPLRERGMRNEEIIYSEVEKLLDMVGVPKDMRYQVPAEISTGMKRSVAIARALAESPEAVLYDEPTTMTDPLMSRRLTELIHRLKVQRRLTSVVVTHDMRLAESLADQVIFLDQGRVVFLGTVAEMERSAVPIVREFLELDRIDLKSLLGPGGSRGLAAG
jgi:phospholipid/cholesterol/gamma-HCH transport system ATP-binding protein